MERKTWKELKNKGSKHYKTGEVEPIDLYKSAKPLPTLSAFAVKALTDTIKYAYRMLTQKGINEPDCDKIIHYIELSFAEKIEQEETINEHS